MPFHASARVLLLEFTAGWVKKPPTATQREACGHETPAMPRPSASERGPGTFSRCQLVPFHVSAKAPVPGFPGALVEFPTAMQRAAAVQDTPFSDLAPVRGFAVLMSRQLVPFHAAAKLGKPGPAPWFWEDPPTAMQRKPRVQDTDSSVLVDPTTTPSVRRTRQLVPFHASEKVSP
jgi:hypothetical protein